MFSAASAIVGLHKQKLLIRQYRTKIVGRGGLGAASALFAVGANERTHAETFRRSFATIATIDD